MEILYLKSIITEMKSSLEKLKSRFKMAEEESINLKTDQYKLSILKNRKKIDY